MNFVRRIPISYLDKTLTRLFPELMNVFESCIALLRAAAVALCGGDVSTNDKSSLVSEAEQADAVAIVRSSWSTIVENHCVKIIKTCTESEAIIFAHYFNDNTFKRYFLKTSFLKWFLSFNRLPPRKKNQLPLLPFLFNIDKTNNHLFTEKNTKKSIAIIYKFSFSYGSVLFTIGIINIKTLL